MTNPRCPPHRYCLKCNPRAIYLDPKPRIDCVYCKNCGAQVPLTEYAKHLEGCEPKSGIL